MMAIVKFAYEQCLGWASMPSHNAKTEKTPAKLAEVKGEVRMAMRYSDTEIKKS
ncbi:MAG: hypothetical protein KME52_10420 [Desmonostoc geniculatum HA4340-LM1]|nr:hypothetical protein [Desmonostoc geniculatum HA4340-LM1]